MKGRTWWVLFLLSIAAPLELCAKDKKPSVPEVFGRAHTAYVEAVEGQQFDRDLPPDEREAIADVQDALQAWKRYRLVTQREDAEIVFVVRKGQVIARDGSAGMETPNLGRPGMGGSPIPGQGGAGPAAAPGGSLTTEDLLEVCLVNSDGKLSKPLWTRTFRDGLSAPQMLLLRQFRDEVDKAYPISPASPTGSEGAKP